MAAYIDIQEPGHPKFTITWYIGQKFKYNPHQIIAATIDGDEQFFIDYRDRIKTITGTEAILYGIFIKTLYKDGVEPTITEEGINALLKGNSNPQAN